MKQDKIEFQKLGVDESRYGEVIYNLYAVVRKDRCEVKEEIDKLDDTMIDEIISIASFMATVENYKSKKLKWTLKKYSYGELRPEGHRVFFFRKCGKNIIFFGYHEKKKDSILDELYERLEKEKQIYEKEFEQFHKKLSG